MFDFSVFWNLVRVERYYRPTVKPGTSTLTPLRSVYSFKLPNWSLAYFLKISVLMMKGIEDIRDCDKLDNNLTRTLL